MSDLSSSSGSAGATSTSRRSRRGAVLLSAGVGLLTLAVVAIVTGLLLVQRVHRVRQQAQVLRAQLQSVQGSLRQGSGSSALRTLDTQQAALQRSAAALKGSTSGLLWSITDWVPGLSKPMGAARSLSLVAADLADKVVPTYTSTLTTISGQSIASGLNLAPLVQARGPLDAGVIQVAALRSRVAGIPHTGIGGLDAATVEVRDDLATLSGYATTLSVVAHVAPAMLGVDGDRTHIVILQTPAEARGTGGLVGGLVELRASHGKVQFVRGWTDQNLTNAKTPVVQTDPQFQNLYGTRGATTQWVNSNLSPDFPPVAAIWAGLFQATIGPHVDGVIGLTPEALAPILAVTGPVTTPTGLQITQYNVASYLEKGLYVTYPKADQESIRVGVELEIQQAVVSRMLAFTGDPLPLLTAFGKVIDKGELRLYSTHPDEQSQLLEMPVSGALSAAPGPFFGSVVVNADGSKLDAYLQRRLTYRREAIPGDPKHQRVVATATFTNTAPPSGLPEYVIFRDDLSHNRGNPPNPGAHKFLPVTYLADDAVFQRLLVGGQQTTPALMGRERDHLWVEAPPVVVLPGHTTAVTVEAIEPTSSAPVGTLVQPTVIPVQRG